MYELLFGKHNEGRKLKITSSTSTTVSRSSSPPSHTPFKLPDDWVVELRPRKDGRFDKYYYEPGTGNKFRSLAAIQNYLNGDINASRKKLKPCNEDNMAILPSNFMRNPSFRLPNGWVVEEKPRNNINYASTVDRTFIEPGTGKRFRSFASVERYIAEKNVCAATSNLGYFSVSGIICALLLHNL
ncbi:methyl-CPG-binding domain 7 [Euphorbia peplus]|nr:methyl-CPG-binding domain 7 [Euphorbia peplus]